MKNRRLAMRIAAIALVGTSTLLVSCSDQLPMAPPPPPPPNASLLGGLLRPIGNLLSFVLTTVTGVLRLEPLSNDIRVSTVISRRGGVIDIPQTGLHVVVPPNAFSAWSMRITVTARAGNAVAYDFEPSGTHFLVPLTVTQDLSSLNWSPSSDLQGAYYADSRLIDPRTGIAVVSEFEPTTVDTRNGKLSFKISHFSGYMVSSGRANLSR